MSFLQKKLVLYLPSDGDNKDIGPNQLNPEELIGGTGANVYIMLRHVFSGEKC